MISRTRTILLTTTVMAALVAIAPALTNASVKAEKAPTITTATVHVYSPEVAMKAIPDEKCTVPAIVPEATAIALKTAPTAFATGATPPAAHPITAPTSAILKTDPLGGIGDIAAAIRATVGTQFAVFATGGAVTTAPLATS